jgi:hypothetical protein
MKYVDNWDKIKQRHIAFWHKEIIDRCCIWVTAPKDGAKFGDFPLPQDRQERLQWWTDGEQVLKRNKNWYEGTFYGGDSFPVLIHDLGPASHAGFFKGARYQFENTVWFFPSLEDYDQLVFDKTSFIYNKTLDLARYYSNESKGDFIISMPDTVGAADALAHLRGTEDLLADMLCEPDSVKAALEKIQAVWEHTYTEIYNIVSKNNDGGCSVGWLGTWAPGRHGQLQCDLSVMLSPKMFEDMIQPELKKQSDWFDFSLYHLDGDQQVKHLETILSIDRIHAIQWTNVAGQPASYHYIDVLKRIQAAGKGLILHVMPQEIEFLMENLSSKGLYLMTYAENQEEACQLVKTVEKLTHE